MRSRVGNRPVVSVSLRADVPRCVSRRVLLKAGVSAAAATFSSQGRYYETNNADTIATA